ncbi:MAG: AmmeMemoRadiSam system radical SAM enzyme [Carboxydocellales bacterium]
MQPAEFYQPLEDGRVYCLLCPQGCKISEGQKGFCRVRQNREGKLYTLNYGQVTSFGLDPIEKKPLFHFYPGGDVFSLGTVGCNLRCGFCQNWGIAHGEPKTTELSPAEAVGLAVSQGGEWNLGIAYTYSEPLMWYEFVLETAQLAREKGLKNVLVTNGFIKEQPLKKLLPYIDAMNIDVKGFTGDYYGEICRGKLEPVLRTVEIASTRCHVEITTLLVTDLNDSPEEVGRLTQWLAGISKDIPLHLSRYFPNYQLENPATPLDRMNEAYRVAKQQLNYVYLGNVQQQLGRDTLCPQCGQLLISRQGYRGEVVGIVQGHCQKCQQNIPVVLG